MGCTTPLLLSLLPEMKELFPSFFKGAFLIFAPRIKDGMKGGILSR